MINLDIERIQQDLIGLKIANNEAIIYSVDIKYRFYGYYLIVNAINTKTNKQCSLINLFYIDYLKRLYNIIAFSDIETDLCIFTYTNLDYALKEHNSGIFYDIITGELKYYR